MRKALLRVLLLALIFLVGCQTASSEPVQPSFEPAPTIEPSPTPAPTEVNIQPDYCVDCHTDKEQLITSAKPEVLVESESSGSG